MIPGIFKHIICCNGGLYLQSTIQRLHVSADLISWTENWTDYMPPYYDSPVLHNKPWADPSLGIVLASLFIHNS